MNCYFPYVDDDCSSTISQQVPIFYNFSRVLSITMASISLIVTAAVQYKLYLRFRTFDLSRLDQRITFFIFLTTIIAMIRAIDPEGWGGIWPPHFYASLLFIQCTLVGIISYFLIVSFALIYRKVTHKTLSILVYGHILLNIKNLVDISCFLIILIAPSTYGNVVGVYNAVATIFYISMNIAGVHTCSKLSIVLISVTENVRSRKTGRSQTKKLLEKLIWIKRSWTGGIFVWGYQLAAAFFFFEGGYDMITNFYRPPSDIENVFLRILYEIFLDYFNIFASFASITFLNLLKHLYQGAKVETDLVRSLHDMVDMTSSAKFPWISRLMNACFQHHASETLNNEQLKKGLCENATN